MKQKIMIFTLSIFLLSCSNTDINPKNKTVIQEHDYADKYITDSLIILAPGRIYNLRPSEKDNKLFYYISNDSIMEYHLDSVKYKSIMSKYDLGYIVDFYPINQDSIFLLCRFSNNIVLINNKAEIKKIYNIPVDKNLYTIGSHSSKPFHISQNRMAYFDITTTQHLNTNNKYYKWAKEKKEIFYDLNTEKIISHNEFVSLPVDINNAEFAICTQANIDDNFIYYAYYYSDTVYLLDIKQRKLHPKLLKSKYYLPNSKYDTTKYGNIDYNREYIIESNMYSDLRYDLNKNYIYRKFIHKAKPEDNSLNKDWSIIICNKNLEVIKEVFLHGNKYSRYLFVVTSFGVLIEEFETTFNPKKNVHKFKVFNF